jgi:hypothetical protein
VEAECSESFTLEKDLRRHHQTKHSEGPAYSCRCGNETRGKDNFLWSYQGVPRHTRDTDHLVLLSV